MKTSNMRNIEDFPDNDEILMLNHAIESLIKSKYWQAVLLAKSDLNYLLNKRKEWLDGSTN